MGRRRLISPQFFQNADLYDSEVESGLPLRVAFAGLWTVADKRGIFAWSRNQKPAILPYDSCDILEVFAALERGGFVRRYEVQGRAYGIIPTFSRWQTFHVREAASDDPEPPAAETNDGSTALAMPDTALAMPSPPVAVAVAGTSAVAASASTTTTLLPAPRKPRASRAKVAAGGDRKPWLQPYVEAWEGVNGAGSCDEGHLAREVTKLLKAGWDESEILRRLAWYLENKGSEAVLDARELERRFFSPNPTIFRKRFKFFDPAAPSGGGPAADWAEAVAREWRREVGAISEHRVQGDLAAFVADYPSVPVALEALSVAVRNYVKHCRLNCESPVWARFTPNIVGHLPPSLKLVRPEAA